MPWLAVWGNSGVPEWNRFELPASLRYGLMRGISRQRYGALLAAYPGALKAHAKGRSRFDWRIANSLGISD